MSVSKNISQTAARLALAGADDASLVELAYSDAPLQIPLARLGGQVSAESWLCAAPVTRGQLEDIDYAYTPTLCFARLYVADEPQGTQHAAEYAYQRLEALRQHLGFSHVLRVWHYLHDLNRGQGDQERYKQFCVGRAQALEQMQLATGELPAATLVGSRRPGLTMHFILTPSAPRMLENPRQVSAYDYPREYGPRQPAFARAALMRWPQAAPQLFISGTASIVGHRSEHIGDLTGQLDETLHNIRALLAQAEPDIGTLATSDLAFVKVYLRHAHHLDAAQQHLRAALGPDTPVIYLQADLCRQELLVEIEAHANACQPGAGT